MNDEGELHAGGSPVASGRIHWLQGKTLAILFRTEKLTPDQIARINEGPLELHFIDPEGNARWIPDDGMRADNVGPVNPTYVFLTSTNSERWQVMPET